MGLADPLPRSLGRRRDGEVSILVLMDGARRLGVRDGEMAYPRRVSILVLMDGARRPGAGEFCQENFSRFNPCFDGWGSPTFTRSICTCMNHRFNPCFDGWGSPTRHV